MPMPSPGMSAMRRGVVVSSTCSGRRGDRDVLGLEELVDPEAAALAAHAGVLDPAEGCSRVGDDALVEADHPGLEALADAERTVQVTGEDIGDQAELRVV